MFNSSIFFLCINTSIIVLLFWVLSFLGEFFFKRKKYRNTSEIFECGFRSTGSLNVTFNLNFFIIVVLLVLYDLEFFIVIPFLFNWSSASFIAFFYFYVFVGFILFSFIFDWSSVGLTWYI